VTDVAVLAERFEETRPHLRAVAYRMLGSLAEAEDAVQETWLRLNRSETSEIANLGGWLTTVVGRICLDMLRSKKSHPEDLHGVHIPDPILAKPDGALSPEDEALLADSVGLALLVVLNTLQPAERLAFVLHDMFAVPFEEIAPIVDKSPAATRQLASRARRRVQGSPTTPDTDLEEQRKVVDAFLAASREGDFEALVSLLHPDVVLRVDFGPGVPARFAQGAEAVARNASTYSRLAPYIRPILVNGVAGAIAVPDGKVFSVGAYTVRDGLIIAMDILADPERLAKLDLGVLDD
jgi:RNA polymerase sigma factor (sigma-70 family)